MTEIHQYGQELVSSLNIATVYRTLKILVENESLVKVYNPSFGTFYERSGKEHHHHFFYRECKRAYALSGCPIKTNDVVPDGFMIEDHEVFFIGKCPHCSSI